MLISLSSAAPEYQLIIRALESAEADAGVAAPPASGSDKAAMRPQEKRVENILDILPDCISAYPRGN